MSDGNASKKEQHKELARIAGADLVSDDGRGDWWCRFRYLREAESQAGPVIGAVVVSFELNEKWGSYGQGDFSPILENLEKLAEQYLARHFDNLRVLAGDDRPLHDWITVEQTHVAGVLEDVAAWLGPAGDVIPNRLAQVDRTMRFLPDMLEGQLRRFVDDAGLQLTVDDIHELDLLPDAPRSLRAEKLAKTGFAQLRQYDNQIPDWLAEVPDADYLRERDRRTARGAELRKKLERLQQQGAPDSTDGPAAVTVAVGGEASSDPEIAGLPENDLQPTATDELTDEVPSRAATLSGHKLAWFAGTEHSVRFDIPLLDEHGSVSANPVALRFGGASAGFTRPLETFLAAHKTTVDNHDAFVGSREPKIEPPSRQPTVRRARDRAEKAIEVDDDLPAQFATFSSILRQSFRDLVAAHGPVAAANFHARHVVRDAGDLDARFSLTAWGIILPALHNKLVEVVGAEARDTTVIGEVATAMVAATHAIDRCLVGPDGKPRHLVGPDGKRRYLYDDGTLARVAHYRRAAERIVADPDSADVTSADVGQLAVSDWMSTLLNFPERFLSYVPFIDRAVEEKTQRSMAGTAQQAVEQQAGSEPTQAETVQHAVTFHVLVRPDPRKGEVPVAEPSVVAWQLPLGAGGSIREVIAAARQDLREFEERVKPQRTLARPVKAVRDVYRRHGTMNNHHDRLQHDIRNYAFALSHAATAEKHGNYAIAEWELRRAWAALQVSARRLTGVPETDREGAESDNMSAVGAATSAFQALRPEYSTGQTAYLLMPPEAPAGTAVVVEIGPTGRHTELAQTANSRVRSWRDGGSAAAATTVAQALEELKAAITTHGITTATAVINLPVLQSLLLEGFEGNDRPVALATELISAFVDRLVAEQLDDIDASGSADHGDARNVSDLVTVYRAVQMARPSGAISSEMARVLEQHLQLPASVAHLAQPQPASTPDPEAGAVAEGSTIIFHVLTRRDVADLPEGPHSGEPRLARWQLGLGNGESLEEIAASAADQLAILKKSARRQRRLARPRAAEIAVHYRPHNPMREQHEELQDGFRNYEIALRNAKRAIERGDFAVAVAQLQDAWAALPELAAQIVRRADVPDEQQTTVVHDLTVINPDAVTRALAALVAKVSPPSTPTAHMLAPPAEPAVLPAKEIGPGPHLYVLTATRGEKPNGLLVSLNRTGTFDDFAGHFMENLATFEAAGEEAERALADKGLAHGRLLPQIVKVRQRFNTGRWGWAEGGGALAQLVVARRITIEDAIVVHGLRTVFEVFRTDRNKFVARAHGGRSNLSEVPQEEINQSVPRGIRGGWFPLIAAATAEVQAILSDPREPWSEFTAASQLYVEIFSAAAQDIDLKLLDGEEVKQAQIRNVAVQLRRRANAMRKITAGYEGKRWSRVLDERKTHAAALELKPWVRQYVQVLPFGHIDKEPPLPGQPEGSPKDSKVLSSPHELVLRGVLVRPHPRDGAPPDPTLATWTLDLGSGTTVHDVIAASRISLEGLQQIAKVRQKPAHGGMRDQQRAIKDGFSTYEAALNRADAAADRGHHMVAECELRMARIGLSSLATVVLDIARRRQPPAPDDQQALAAENALIVAAANVAVATLRPPRDISKTACVLMLPEAVGGQAQIVELAATGQDTELAVTAMSRAHTWLDDAGATADGARHVIAKLKDAVGADGFTAGTAAMNLPLLMTFIKRFESDNSAVTAAVDLGGELVNGWLAHRPALLSSAQSDKPDALDSATVELLDVYQALQEARDRPSSLTSETFRVFRQFSPWHAHPSALDAPVQRPPAQPSSSPTSTDGQPEQEASPRGAASQETTASAGRGSVRFLVPGPPGDEPSKGTVQELPLPSANGDVPAALAALDTAFRTFSSDLHQVMRSWEPYSEEREYKLLRSQSLDVTKITRKLRAASSPDDLVQIYVDIGTFASAVSAETAKGDPDQSRDTLESLRQHNTAVLYAATAAWNPAEAQELFPVDAVPAELVPAQKSVADPEPVTPKVAKIPVYLRGGSDDYPLVEVELPVASLLDSAALTTVLKTIKAAESQLKKAKVSTWIRKGLVSAGSKFGEAVTKADQGNWHAAARFATLGLDRLEDSRTISIDPNSLKKAELGRLAELAHGKFAPSSDEGAGNSADSIIDHHSTIVANGQFALLGLLHAAADLRKTLNEDIAPRPSWVQAKELVRPCRDYLSEIIKAYRGISTTPAARSDKSFSTFLNGLEECMAVFTAEWPKFEKVYGASEGSQNPIEATRFRIIAQEVLGAVDDVLKLKPPELSVLNWPEKLLANVEPESEAPTVTAQAADRTRASTAVVTANPVGR